MDRSGSDTQARTRRVPVLAQHRSGTQSPAKGLPQENPAASPPDRAPTEQASLRAVLRQRDFLKLWGGQTLSLFGSQVTVLALPLTAIFFLHASAGELGILNAAKFAPFLLLPLFAGVWIDRHRRRPVLIVADLGRAILIGLIPLLATLGLLRVEYLYGIALCLGVFTVFFDLAYQAYLPALVGREALAMGNSTLQVSASVAEAGGPGLGGLLIQWLTAPIALVTDAASYLISAISLSVIRKAEPEPMPPAARPPLRQEIAAGLALVYRNPHLRALAGAATTFNLFAQAVETVFVLYATRDLGLEAGVLGLIIACGSVGALIGAVAAVQMSRRFGLGPVLLGAVIIECVPALLIPLAAGPRLAVIGLLALGFFLPGIGLGISNVLVISLRQAVTPDELLGRVNASYRTLTYGMIPLGALLGGGLGDVIGLRATLLVGALGLLLSIGWVVFSPIPRLRALPTLDTGLPAEPDTG